MKILVTGAAGFIGYHTANRLLLNKKNKVVGIDSMNNYYDKKLKYQRISKLKKTYKKNFHFIKLNLCQKKKVINLFKIHKFNKVINLAAQAGVRYSIKNPESYFKNNLLGFFNVLEACKFSKSTTCYLQAAVAFMELTKKFHLMLRILLIILFSFMLQQKEVMKF